MVSIIKRYQLSNGRLQKNFTQILSSFTWMCSKCTAFNFCGQCIAQSSRQFCAIYWLSLQDYGLYVRFCEWTALIGATVHLNQQRKSSSFGRSSGSQKHSTVCVSVCGGSPSCQVCNILVSSLLFKALVIDYSCQTVSVTVWHAIFAQVIFVFFQLSSCLVLGASVTVYGKVGMVVLN